MPRPPSPHLTEHELGIMKILWLERPLTVALILDRLPGAARPAYTSLLTAVRSMEQKGYLKHVKQGKAFYYSPTFEEHEYKNNQLKKIVAGLFDGSPYDLAVSLLKSEKLEKSEIEQLRSMLEDL